MNDNTWLWILGGVAAVYFLTKPAPVAAATPPVDPLHPLMPLPPVHDPWYLGPPRFLGPPIPRGVIGCPTGWILTGRDRNGVPVCYPAGVPIGSTITKTDTGWWQNGVFHSYGGVAIQPPTVTCPTGFIYNKGVCVPNTIL